MQILEHETSRAIRFFSSSGDTGRGPHLMRAFMDRYEFMEGPVTVEQYDSKKGVVFRGGFFDGVEIDKVQLYDVGLMVEGKSDTKALDAFIDDVINWATTQRSIRIEPNEGETSIRKAFLSQFVVTFTPKITPPGPMILELAQTFEELMKSNGVPPSPFAVTGLSFGPDPASGANWGYRFERRVHQSFESNQWFSSAPLTTADHIRFVEKIERVISDQPNASPPPS